MTQLSGGVPAQHRQGPEIKPQKNNKGLNLTGIPIYGYPSDQLSLDANVWPGLTFFKQVDFLYNTSIDLHEYLAFALLKQNR